MTTTWLSLDDDDTPTPNCLDHLRQVAEEYAGGVCRAVGTNDDGAFVVADAVGRLDDGLWIGVTVRQREDKSGWDIGIHILEEES